MVRHLRQLLSGVLAFMLVFAGAPASALATIYELTPDAISSSTNPSAINKYESVWREGWGNDLLPSFSIQIPQPADDPAEPAIIGGYYYINRPGSLPATINAGYWPQSYWAPVTNPSTWKLYTDIPSEIANPGPLFDTAWVPPIAPTRAVEGPYTTQFQFVAKDTTTAAAAWFPYGIDVTPPQKVTGLQAIPGVGVLSVTGWLKQSRVLLKWDDVKYDSLSGTGYFEAFLDGAPYPVAVDDPSGRRVYDLKEHYPGYGMTINTKREMVIEDLPAGTHTLQVRAVDRGTNAGPLSDLVVIQVDPDVPAIAIAAPEVDGERLGAKPTFRATVTDRGGVASVAFSVDGVVKGTDLAAPYEFADDLSALADGSGHTLRVTATDVAGRTNFAEKTFVIDKKPTVSVVSPAFPGQVVSPLVPLRVSYSDKTGVTGVVFRVDGGIVGSVVPASGQTTQGVSSILQRAAAGAHTLSVTVTNDVGGVATVNSSFNVDATKLPVLADYVSTPLPEGQLPVWYNTEYPTFTAITDASVTDPTEVLYTVDRAPGTALNPLNPNAYSASFRTEAGTTYLTGVVDQNGVYLSNPGLFDGALQLPGVARPTEGVWYTHAAVRNALGQSGATVSTVYGIDLTSPNKVTGLAAYANASTATPATGWLQQTRAVVKWNGTERDALSGTKAYNVYLDGERIGDAGDKIAFQPGRATMSLTLENLEPGGHKVTITAVDQAGNESAASDPLSVNIFSTPSVRITNPASDDTNLPTPAPLVATVRDAAGISSVTFTVDGNLVKTFAPSAADPTVLVCRSNVPLADGAHTLTVRATSVSGPVTTETRTFKVDAALPPEVDPPSGGGDDDGGGPVVTTAFTWFNTAFPTFSAVPSKVPTEPIELLYLVDRSSVTPIDSTTPNLYDAFFDAKGTTYFNGVIDQYGVYLSDPGAFDGAIQMPGRVTSPLEGVWYIHALARNAEGAGGPITHVGYGVDLTSPAVVGGVAVYSSSYATAPLSEGVLTQNRAVIRWSGTQRDALSGTKYFLVYVDGTPLGADGSIPYEAGRSVMSLTVENLAPGKHTIEVSAVDNALNEGPKSSELAVYVDTDVPRLFINAPATDGLHLSAHPVVSALATDNAGITDVGFEVDGSRLGNVTSAAPQTQFTATKTLDLSGFASGTHTLRITARDVAGHTITATRTFVLDKTAPVISSVSGAPSPFFPRKRDGYKDNFKVKFKTSEAGTAKVVIKNSSGKVVRTLTKSVGSGGQYVLWNGKQTAGAVKSGTFKWTLTMTDASGNARSVSARRVTIKFYQIVRTGSASVRIVSR